MRIYISGKIGEEVISEATRQKFVGAEEMLKSLGHDVFNPTSPEWQAHLHKNYTLNCYEQPHGDKVSFYAYSLLRDMMVLATCDAVYFLKDWDMSPGSGAENSFAMAIGKKMLWQRLEDAQVFHGDNETADDVWLPID